MVNLFSSHPQETCNDDPNMTQRDCTLVHNVSFRLCLAPMVLDFEVGFETLPCYGQDNKKLNHEDRSKSQQLRTVAATISYVLRRYAITACTFCNSMRLN
jgi:hypothetical protein